MLENSRCVTLPLPCGSRAWPAVSSARSRRAVRPIACVTRDSDAGNTESPMGAGSCSVAELSRFGRKYFGVKFSLSFDRERRDQHAVGALVRLGHVETRHRLDRPVLRHDLLAVDVVVRAVAGVRDGVRLLDVERHGDRCDGQAGPRVGAGDRRARAAVGRRRHRSARCSGRVRRRDRRREAVDRQAVEGRFLHAPSRRTESAPRSSPRTAAWRSSSAAPALTGAVECLRVQAHQPLRQRDRRCRRRSRSRCSRRTGRPAWRP